MENQVLLSIVTPCFNEEDNVRELYSRIKLATKDLVRYKFEIIFIDNNSEDGTVVELKKLAINDPMVKLSLIREISVISDRPTMAFCSLAEQQQFTSLPTCKIRPS